jgi:hypothetical protein
MLDQWSCLIGSAALDGAQHDASAVKPLHPAGQADRSRIGDDPEVALHGDPPGGPVDEHVPGRGYDLQPGLSAIGRVA